MYKRISAILLLVLHFAIPTFAQGSSAADSLSLTLPDAESLFLQKNFQLLAAKFNVGASEAAIVQARLYPNPTLSIDQGAYNKETNKWFDVSKNGQTAVSLQQLILLGGKRSNAIGLAKINAQITTFQFNELIESLRYELRTSFYQLYFNLQSIAVYDKEIASVSQLVAGYSDQYTKGNIAFKELARLQSLQFGLENERLGLISETASLQGNLALLTGDTTARPIKPIVDDAYLQQLNPSQLVYAQVLDSAMANRCDLQSAKSQVDFNKVNLQLQKSLRIPDITLGANWDRNGSYITNYNSLSLAFSLPFWDRNQGNVKIAHYQIDAANEQLSAQQLKVRTDINAAFNRVMEAKKLYTSASRQFTPDYDKLLDGISKGYQNHSINLLEFIDYYETYKDSKIEFNKLQNELLTAVENLNLATGTIIIK